MRGILHLLPFALWRVSASDSDTRGKTREGKKRKGYCTVDAEHVQCVRGVALPPAAVLGVIAHPIPVVARIERCGDDAHSSVAGVLVIPTLDQRRGNGRHGRGGLAAGVEEPYYMYRSRGWGEEG